MCLTLVLQDPSLRLWNVGVSDDGLFNTTSGNRSYLRTNPIYHIAAGSGGYGGGGFGGGDFGAGVTLATFYQLSIDTNGLFITAPFSPGPKDTTILSSLLLSPHGFKYKLEVGFSGGVQSTYAPNDVFFDRVPMPLDVTMSLYGTGDLLTCASCNNAITNARADLGLWCCACQSFVLPEDTNLLVLLDE